MDMKLEIVVIPVSDVDRAKAFYEKVGFCLDIDLVDENFRALQFTPPNSGASIIFGKGVTSAQPGSIDQLVLAVDNVDAAQKRRNKVIRNHRLKWFEPASAPSATGPDSPVARTRHTAGNGRIIGWSAAGGRVSGVNFAAARRRALLRAFAGGNR